MFGPEKRCKDSEHDEADTRHHDYTGGHRIHNRLINNDGEQGHERDHRFRCIEFLLQFVTQTQSQVVSDVSAVDILGRVFFRTKPYQRSAPTRHGSLGFVVLLGIVIVLSRLDQAVQMYFILSPNIFI